MILPHFEEAGGSKEPKALPAEQTVCEDSASDWLGLGPNCHSPAGLLTFSKLQCSQL